jgi:hypothetical protein
LWGLGFLGGLGFLIGKIVVVVGVVGVALAVLVISSTVNAPTHMVTKARRCITNKMPENNLFIFFFRKKK